jgi:two-component system nitrogen regulation sensor histidine kinase NtrY
MSAMIKVSKRFLGWPLGLLMLVCGGIGGYLAGTPLKDKYWYVQQTHNVRARLAEKEQKTETILHSLVADTRISQQSLRISSKLENEGVFLFVYENDRLVFWNTTRVPMPGYNFDDDFLPDILKLRNGWYRVLKDEQGTRQAIGLVLIKHDFFINNEFLRDGFEHAFDLDKSVGISTRHIDSDFHVTDKGGRFLFALVFPESQLGELRYPVWAGAAYLISLLALLYTLFSLRHLRFFRKRPAIHILLFTFIVSAIRIANIYFEYPPVLYDLPLFAPEHFASSKWLPSLGDFLLHALLLTALLILIFLNFSKFQIKLLNEYSIQGWILFFGFIAAGFAFIFHLLIRTLVFDSNISFDLSNILDLDAFSFVGFSLITILLVNYFIIVHFCSKMLARSKRIKTWRLLALTFIPFIPFAAVGYWLEGLNLPALFLPYFIYLAVMNIHFREKVVYDFYSFVPSLILFSGYATFLLWQLNSIKELEQRKVLALKIAEEQDHVAEFLFLDAAEQLRNDRIVRHHLFNHYRSYPYEFFERIAQQYFSGYWSKYALVIMPFDHEELEELNSGSEWADPDLKAYEYSIENYGKPTASPDFYFLDNLLDKVSYLGKIRVEQVSPKGDTMVKYIYLEFISKMVTQVTGFPELLLDENVIRPVHLGNYSYAVYKGKQLHIAAGDYSYLLDSRPFENPTDDLELRMSEGYRHLIYRPEPGKLIVVSLAIPSFLDVLNPFAYLLLYFAVILFLVFSYRYYFENPGRVLRFTLKGRIQLTIFLILLFSLILVGLGIQNYIRKQFERKNKSTIEEKVNAILSELKGELDGRMEWPDRENMNYMLTRYAQIFFTDINLYKPNGSLWASSREGIFNEGLVSRQMNPRAFRELSQHLQPNYLHREFIGNFEYLSAYAVLRDGKGQVNGFLNLPYFLRQSDLREEISSSLLALINIYSLLIVASMVLSLFIANRLTGPLSILQSNLSRLRLGKENAFIAYKGNDEISGLVDEYNHMVRELGKSAELLARSERESAWKEMARQVAHEVKNPLTPMKLNVQYLLRAWEDKRPDFDERLRKFRDGMLEQIETLSDIASEFSYFAKLPETRKVKMDLKHVIANAIHFYESNEINVQLKLHCSHEQVMVMADRDQMLRVFNNLIRNALQAIPSGRAGKIDIRISKKEMEWKIEVQDNGLGVPLEVKDKIFLPNFTTKSSGMGLGLAMTRTIIEQSDGQIGFVTEENKGTSFIITLPAV